MKRIHNGIDYSFFFISATWPQEVRRIAARYMRNPIQVYIGTLDLAVCILCIYIQLC